MRVSEQQVSALTLTHVYELYSITCQWSSSCSLSNGRPINIQWCSDVNKDWTCKDKDQDKDNDLTHKDQDNDKDFTYSYLLQVAAKPLLLLDSDCRLYLQSLSSNNNEHKVKVHNIWL